MISVKYSQCIDCIRSKMKRKQVNAILSDYDGTLCPTTAVKGNTSNGIGKIPQGLEKILFRLSDRIPVCVISSKDFTYLHNRVRFAKVLSCILGIEPLSTILIMEIMKLTNLVV
jgi:trehalose-6-phosphatase